MRMHKRGIMKNIKTFITTLSMTTKRYYMTVLHLVMLCVFTILTTRFWYEEGFLLEASYELLERLSLASAYGVLSSFVIHLYLEQKTIFVRGIRQRLAMVFGNVLMFGGWLVLAYHLMENTSAEGFARVMVIGCSLAILALSLPQIKKEGMVQHLTTLITKAALSFLFTLAIFLSQVFIAFSLNHLFELGHLRLLINEYDVLAIFAWTFVFPFLFISMYPKADDELKPLSFVYRIVVFYIAVPLLVVYTFVLYTYFLKLLMEWHFPNNIVANLVLWYLFISHVVVYVLFGVKFTRNEFERLIQKNAGTYLPVLVVPSAIMFFSIYIRISIYGFTVPRYLLLVFAVFNVLGLVMLYVFKRWAHSPVLLLAVTILYNSFFGELSASNVSLRSQQAIVAEKLALAGYVYDDILSGAIAVNDVSLDTEQAMSMSSNLDYIYWNDLDDSLDPDERKINEALHHRVNMIAGDAEPMFAAAQEDYQYIRFQNYDNIYSIGEEEYLFSITSFSSVEVEPFLITADRSRVNFYLSDNNELCASYSIGEMVVNANAGGDYVYHDHFNCGDDLYKVTYVIDYAYFAIDPETGVFIDDQSNFFQSQVILSKE